MKIKYQLSNSETIERKRAIRGWDPAFFLVSGEINKKHFFLVRLGKRGRK